MVPPPEGCVLLPIAPPLAQTPPGQSAAGGGGGDLSALAALVALPLFFGLAFVARRKLRKPAPRLRGVSATVDMLPPPKPKPQGAPPVPPPAVRPTRPPVAKAPGRGAPTAVPPSAEGVLAPQSTACASKFRWGVDVGHYYWRGGGGAAGPMNVGWGKKGATCSTPRVLNEIVTLESNAAAAQPSPRDQPMRTHKRSTASGEPKRTETSRGERGSQSRVSNSQAI
jgi:hypothetical protein